VLVNLGVQLNTVRQRVEFIIGRGDRIVLGNIGLTPRAKKVIELAVEEARRLNHHYIGTEHLLLGLVREGEGIASGVLESLGVNLDRVRQETLRVLKQSTGTIEEEIVPGNTLQWKTTSNFDDYQFTRQVENVLSLAQEESLRLQHNYLGTEHILLGLIREEGSAASHILKSFGADPGRTRSGIETFVGRGERTQPGAVPLTPLARAQIHLAADEANRMGHGTIATEHLLLGLLREGEGVASSVLGSIGVNLEMLRTKTIQFIQERDEK